MTLEFFVLVAFAGILATYVHMLFALWAHRFGLPRLDFCKVLAELSFGESFDGKPPYWLGLLQIHLNGIVFALLYATVVARYLPGEPVVKGLIFGGILFVASQLVFVPLFLREGFFILKLHPRAWMTAVVVHGIYGGILGWLSPILK